VDLILQHRDSEIDQVKRKSGWTLIMRCEAVYQVTKTVKICSQRQRTLASTKA
jgi:hypothetical protein